MTHQYIKAGPASKIASQVRHITLDDAVLTSVNQFIDDLVISIIQEVMSSREHSSQTSSTFLHPNDSIIAHTEQKIKHEQINQSPITTESFKNAVWHTCGKSNFIIKEAILEAELLLNEWTIFKGQDSDPALAIATEQHSTQCLGRGKGLLGVPPFAKGRLNGSTSTLHSISDVGEDEEEGCHSDGNEEAAGIRMPPTSYSYDPTRKQAATTYEAIPAPVYIAELQEALANISPLGNASHLPPSFQAYSKVALAHIKAKRSSYISPLLALYVSKFLSHIAKEVIKGIADIVEMNPKMSEANLEILQEYIRGNDDVGMLWMKLSSETLPRSTLHTLSRYPPSPTNTSSLLLPDSLRPKSETDPQSLLPLIRSTSTSSNLTPSASRKSTSLRRRLSIEAELARAHSDIINLSRASPIERIAAESIRRKSWGETEVDTAALGLLKEGEAMYKQDEDQVSDRKIDGIEPVTKEGQEEALCDETGIDGTMTATMAHTPQMEEYKDFNRPSSSLSVVPTSHISSGFIGMFRRPSTRKQDKHNENEDKEIASEMMSKRLNGNRSPSRNSSHRSKSSMGNGRNVISKSNGAGGRKSSGRERQGSQAGLQIVINKQPTTSNKSSSKRPSTSPNGQAASRRLSEDPDFEDLIMRGDTLKMTLTPSRFRQSSKDGGVGSVYGTPPRRMHGASSSSSTKRHGSNRPRGYSNMSKDTPSSSSTSLDILSSTQFPFSSGLTPKSGVRLRARPATATRSTLLGDDEASSNTEIDESLDANDDDEAEELNLDSEDEAILSPAERKKRQIRLSQKRGAAGSNGRTLKGKESLFDILNSAPPWENDGDNQGVKRGGLSNGGSSKAERMMGMTVGPGTQVGKSVKAVNGGLQPAGHTGPPKAFAPIANLDMLASIGPPSPVDALMPLPKPTSSSGLDSQSIRSRTTAISDSASTLYAAPSVADIRSLLPTTTSLDGQSDFFSSKASFALTSKEFPLPPSFHTPQDTSRLNGMKHSSLSPAATFSNNSSPYRSNSYKSTPDFNASNGGHGTTSTTANASASGPSDSQMRPMQRRLQAKDEREVDKGVNDDLIAFLRDAGPPPPPPSTSFPNAPSQASLPLSSHSGNATSVSTKTRLGSVNFRSFMRGHSKRPSTAPGTSEIGETGIFGKSSALNGNGSDVPASSMNERRPSGAGLGELPSVDEMGRFRPSIANGQNGRAIHGSLLNMGRRQSEYKESNVAGISLSPSSIHHTRHGAKNTIGSVPPAAYLAHSAQLQQSMVPHSSSASNLQGKPTTTTSTMIMTSGHAASPAAKQAEKVWELAEIKERELELEIAKKKLEEERLALRLQQLRALEDAKMVAREVGPHPAPSAAATSAARSVLLTPEHSTDDLYRMSEPQNGTQHLPISQVPMTPVINQAQAVSGVDTPPTTPSGTSYTPPQFTPLQPLLEDSEMKNRTSTSSVSASPSTVMPGMAHKHQRRLSAVRRKPSPRVEGDEDHSRSHLNETIAAAAVPSATALLYSYDASAHGREASSSSQSSGLEPAIVTPATKLVEEYRGSSQAPRTKIVEEESGNSIQPVQVGEASIRSVPATVNSVSSSTRLADITNATLPAVMRSASTIRSASTTITSRPPSTVLMPLSPRYATMSSNGLRGADVHDILLGLRNNMISATSVSGCLEMIDAVLFEVAYDTKDSKAPSIIEEEEAGNTSSALGILKAAHASSKVIEAAKKEEMAIQVCHGRKARTSRYINRTYDAIIQYYLLDPLALSVASQRHYSLSLSSAAIAEPLESDGDIQLAEHEASVHKEQVPTDVPRTPSLGYSISPSTESDDAAATATDKTCSDDILVADIEYSEPTSINLKIAEVVRAAAEEEEQELLQKAAEIV